MRWRHAARVAARGALLLALLFLLPGCVHVLDFCNKAWSAPGSNAAAMYYTPTHYHDPHCQHGHR